MNTRLRWPATVLALSVPLQGWAAAPADPAAAPAPAPPLRYESAFADYKPWREMAPANWRQLNDSQRTALGSAHDRHHHHGGAATAGAAPTRPPATAPGTANSAAAPASAPAGPAPTAAPATPQHKGHTHHGAQP